MDQKVPHVPYNEPDMGFEMTAIAAGYLTGKQRKFFQKMKLLS